MSTLRLHVSCMSSVCQCLPSCRAPFKTDKQQHWLFFGSLSQHIRQCLWPRTWVHFTNIKHCFSSSILGVFTNASWHFPPGFVAPNLCVFSSTLHRFPLAFVTPNLDVFHQHITVFPSCVWVTKSGVCHWHITMFPSGVRHQTWVFSLTPSQSSIC